jgi:tetratricopeptide (TPR) repeat protein
VSSFGLVLLIVGAWSYLQPAETVESKLEKARLQLAGKNHIQALLSARQILARHPRECRAALIAARASVALHDDSTALQFLEKVAEQSGPECTTCRRLASEIAQRSGQARTAERFLTLLADADPPDIDAANQLAYLLGVEGRAFEATVRLFVAVRSGNFTPHHLIMLAAGEPVVSDDAFVDRCLEAAPDDPLPLLGRAREALGGQDFETAEPHLLRIVGAVPDSQEAQARWGSFLLQRGTAEQFVQWHKKLPEKIWHPEIWVVRGQWARRNSEPRVATRCFWEALRLDPDHRVACYQLGQLLQEAGRTEESAACFHRASQLEKLAYLVDRIYENPQATHLLLEAAQLTESLGRIWESWGWALQAGLDELPDSPANVLALRMRSRLTPELPRTVAEARLADRLDLANEPLPRWESRGTAPVDAIARVEPATVRFEDVAASANLNFQYDNGHEPGSETTRMLESMGGGVAVVDFDLDGWPDIYFTQAGPWEPGSDAQRPPDAFFRNQFGQSFVEITGLAGLGDREFSQGCTIGDFDSDGFPDVYVANIGRNRLYRNQGDGTFIDVTEDAGIAGERWTTSCLLADVNGDGLPDVYDVNYLSIHEAPRTLCVRGEEARTCGPGSFHAEPDQLYVNLGDGRFQNVTESSGIQVPNGKGLGIVAADFSETGRINLFVANDSLPNFYFVNQTEGPGQSPRFTEEALISGLALSHDGLSAAWMGVAAGDANGDGRLDLFATTYADQAKSLFVQEADGGMFTDAIVASGLNAPSWKLLGFGTQFLDGELDGWPDLVVTNGHVYDLSHQQKPYQMPPQYFQNVGHGKFDEVPATQLGPFFSGKYLGRGLARLDWNRDGLDDFVVSHMNSPASLVTNRTQPHGHFFTIRVVGTRSGRDGIGTRVTVQAGGRTWTQQLTAGDGYHASNERKLHFGLGASSTIDEVTVQWLSGESVVLKDPQVDAEWLLIEGQRHVSRLVR